MPTILYVYAKTSNVSIELQEEFKQLYALVVRNNRKLATQTGFDQNGTNPPAALPAHAAEQGRGDMGWTNPAPGGLAGQMQSRPGGQPLSANPGMAPAASAAASSAAPVSMPAPTPVAATGNRQAAAGQASNATTQAAAGPSDGTFAADIEEEANSYFQKIYTSQQSIKDIISMLQGFKNSTNPREQDIFKCMIHNLFDEYRFFPKYPDKELKITGILFGSLIQHGLVSSITLGIAFDTYWRPSRSQWAARCSSLGSVLWSSSSLESMSGRRIARTSCRFPICARATQRPWLTSKPRSRLRSLSSRKSSLAYRASLSLQRLRNHSRSRRQQVYTLPREERLLFLALGQRQLQLAARVSARLSTLRLCWSTHRTL